ncbi:TetR/AcrR family transcriptional regulator [Xanthomonas hyacinthi]|uniref:HTH tetR-type domain-containing protein n=1 Tax=Xanthomonas hyacinthi TaxID=56455 RepID=A0A2S7EZD7_9XANT|nr:TetR/AcrR family transcriptional regulator [Xanthomonas hyacinthi]PPU98543.1 hypothetical protein XhyaCFBP1156_06610 [Xanthomonas hyacinthi]QGY79017.1 TetR/AcrR family transcriptional regulator [Xanthomonas hyacinthi]
MPAPARARRRGEPGATCEKHAAVLGAARQLFSRNGFDSTNMDAIATCAGVSKATVYAHFASKDALFRATVDAMVGEVPDRWEALLGVHAPLQARLAAVAHDIVAMATGPLLTGIHRMLALSTQFSVRHTETYWDLCFARYDRAMRQCLLVETRQGTLAVSDAMQASAQFFGLIAGAPALHALLIGEPFAPPPAAASVDSAVALFVRGYRPGTASAADTATPPAKRRRGARTLAGATHGMPG